MNPKLPMNKRRMTRLPRRSRGQLSNLEVDENGRSSIFLKLGAALRERRISLGLTQKRFAELSELQIATIRNIESGNPGVKLGTLESYLNLLNLTMDLKEADHEGE